jgi:hypothetical protein
MKAGIIRQWMRHVVVDQLETSSLGEVADVLPPSGAEIVDAHDRGTGVEQRVTQVGSDETGTTKYDRAIKVPCWPGSRLECLRQPSGAVNAWPTSWRLTVW